MSARPWNAGPSASLVAGVGAAEPDRVGLRRGPVQQRHRGRNAGASTTVAKWRKRFATGRLDGLVDAPRPGAARTIGDDVVEAVVIDTLESTPPDATHWSTRGLANKHGISHQTVAEIWRAFGLKPWRQDSFKVSPDPDLVEKIRDLVALYMSPPVAAAVFAVDEKPQIQALNRTAPTLPMLPTTPPRPLTTTSATAPATCSPLWRSRPGR